MSETNSSTVTIPVDDALRAFAAEWAGRDLWHREHVDDWYEDTGSRWVPVLPLHIPAGFALGVAFLAKQVGASGPCMWTHFKHLDGWQLRVQERTSTHNDGWMFYAGVDYTNTRHTFIVPALADIPEHCETCRGRGWAMATVATPTPCGDCPDCTDGKHPQRAAMALRACLLASAK